MNEDMSEAHFELDSGIMQCNAIKGSRDSNDVHASASERH